MQKIIKLTALFASLSTLLLYTNNYSFQFDDVHIEKAYLPEDVIIIITDNEQDPKGQYWPSDHTKVDKNGQLLNTALVKIGDISYSDIQESFDFFDSKELVYLGHFTHTDNHPVYLYGKEDKDDDTDVTLESDNGN